MTDNDHLKNIYSIQKHLKKDEIVDKASRMIKDMSFHEKGGMMEVPARHIKELDALMARLDEIEASLMGLS